MLEVDYVHNAVDLYSPVSHSHRPTRAGIVISVTSMRHSTLLECAIHTHTLGGKLFRMLNKKMTAEIQIAPEE